MKKYKQVTISKISDHGGSEKTPTHSIVVRNDEEKVTVGKLWTKTSTYGKFLSGLMSNEYKNPAGQVYHGFVIVDEQELELLEQELELLKSGNKKQELTSAGTKVPDFSEADNSDTPF